MNPIVLEKKAEPDLLLQTQVKKPDLSSMIQILPNSVIEYGEGKVVYASLDPSTMDEFRKVIVQAPTGSHSRLAARKINKDTRSFDLTFGFKPSRPVFGHSAGPTDYTYKHPKGFRKLVKLAELLEEIAIIHLGKEFVEQNFRATNKILPEYRIGKTGFTQGVINRSNQLVWHFDKGNYPDSYSIMLWALHGKISGGELLIPSLNAYAIPTDGGIFIFKGQNLIHGVAPIKKNSIGAERMSVVLYTIAAMEKLQSQKIEFEKSKTREFRKHFK
jgi:hypothetical protein